MQCQPLIITDPTVDLWRSLEGKHYISRGTDSVDARRAVLQITRRGRELYHQIMPMFVAGEQAMLACLSPTELEQLDQILNKMCRAVPDWHNSD